VPSGTDESQLRVDVADFVAHYASQPLDSLDLSGALSEMVEIVRRYRIVLPAPLAMLLKVLIMLEGTGRLLSPRFSLMELMEPYQRTMMMRRISPTRHLKKMRRIGYELEQLAELLPRRLREILQQVQSGKFDVHLDHRGLEPSVNRLVLGMLASALFVGSSLLLSRRVWPVYDASVPGVIGCALSLLLALRLLRAISKSGHLDRRQ
jgi:ubiquinone biosynthesis protein